MEKMARKGCFVCTAKRCDCCKNFLISGASFRSTATGRSYICKSLTCTSRNVVYLAHCVTCNLQELALLSILNLDWLITSRILSITKEHVV